MTPEANASSSEAAEAPLRRRIQAAQLRIRTAMPFFGTLLLFARWEITRSLSTAATDGQTIQINPDFAAGLKAPELDAVLLHEVLHAALQHPSRRKRRDPVRWNFAADVVVNGMIQSLPEFKLPSNAIRKRDLEHLSVEEVYEKLELPPDWKQQLADWGDLLDAGDRQDEMEEPETAHYWKMALQQAEVLALSHPQKKWPAGLTRELGALRPGTLDWRSYLRRFLVQTPVDFQGFDRRFIGRQLYLDALEGESLTVSICIDTSGSITSDEQARLLGEVQNLMQQYPHLSAELFYADDHLYGPWSLNAESPLRKPIGGGGTSFRPFFQHLNRNAAVRSPQVAIYLTDGWGSFPQKPPEVPTLWVVSSGGLNEKGFPFGEVVRMGA